MVQKIAHDCPRCGQKILGLMEGFRLVRAGWGLKKGQAWGKLECQNGLCPHCGADDYIVVTSLKVCEDCDLRVRCLIYNIVEYYDN